MKCAIGKICFNSLIVPDADALMKNVEFRIKYKMPRTVIAVKDCTLCLPQAWRSRRLSIVHCSIPFTSKKLYAAKRKYQRFFACGRRFLI